MLHALLIAQTANPTTWLDAMSKASPFAVLAGILILLVWVVHSKVLPWLERKDERGEAQARMFVAAMKDTTASHERANERNASAIEKVTEGVTEGLELVRNEVKQLRADIMERNSQ